jgi:transcription antitermination protein NusB
MENSVEVGSRNQIQELAMQIMYDFLIQQTINETIDVEKTISDLSKMPYEDCDLFLKEVLIKSLKHENEIIENLSSNLVNWKFSRLNTCVQAILIIAYCNYFYCDNKEKAIIINVAVKLAKKYADKDEYKFVNAILDKTLI